jgi:hypothetical protein
MVKTDSLSQNIPLFLTELLQNRRFLEKSKIQDFKISTVFDIKLLFWSFFTIK